MRLLLSLSIVTLLTGCLELPGAPPDCRDGEAITRKAGKWECIPAGGGGGLTKAEADGLYRQAGAEVPLNHLGQTGCAMGQVLKLEDDAWRCSTDATGTVSAGPGITVDGAGLVSAKFGVLADDVARGSDLQALADAAQLKTDSIAWARIPDAPAFVASPFTCSPGQYLVRGASEFACASGPGLPAHLDALGSLFATPTRKVLDSVAGTSTQEPLVVGASVGTEHAAIDNGNCLVVEHQFGTHAIGYAAWMTDRPAGPDAKWVPVQPGYEPGTTNLALNRPASASSSASSAVTPGYAVNGVLAAGDAWEAVGAGTWQVDLGTIRPVSELRMLVSPSGQSWSMTSWEVHLSDDGASYRGPVLTGACSKPGTCESFLTQRFVAATSARFVQIRVLTFVSGSHITEVEVHSSAYTVSQPDENTLSFCNYTGETRSMALRAWR